ncbi:UNVERIFIED_CONTAM: hypothetical protein NCL1_02772 [Trichonephila clavipes]
MHGGSRPPFPTAPSSSPSITRSADPPRQEATHEAHSPFRKPAAAARRGSGPFRPYRWQCICRRDRASPGRGRSCAGHGCRRPLGGTSGGAGIASAALGLRRGHVGRGRRRCGGHAPARGGADDPCLHRCTGCGCRTGAASGPATCGGGGGAVRPLPRSCPWRGRPGSRARALCGGLRAGDHGTASGRCRAWHRAGAAVTRRAGARPWWRDGRGGPRTRHCGVSPWSPERFFQPTATSS